MKTSRVVATTAAVLLAASLAACGSDNGSSATTSSPTAAAQTTQAAATASVAPGASAGGSADASSGSLQDLVTVGYVPQGTDAPEVSADSITYAATGTTDDEGTMYGVSRSPEKMTVDEMVAEFTSRFDDGAEPTVEGEVDVDGEKGTLITASGRSGGGPLQIKAVVVDHGGQTWIIGAIAGSPDGTRTVDSAEFARLVAGISWK